MRRATRSGRREGGWRESNPRRASRTTSFQNLFRSVPKRWKFGFEEELVGPQDGKGCAEGSRSRENGLWDAEFIKILEEEEDFSHSAQNISSHELDLLARPPSGGASRLEIWGQKIEFEIEWIRELVHVSLGLGLDGTAGDEESWIESGLMLIPDLDWRSEDLGAMIR